MSKEPKGKWLKSALGKRDHFFKDGEKSSLCTKAYRNEKGMSNGIHCPKCELILTGKPKEKKKQTTCGKCHMGTSVLYLKKVGDKMLCVSCREIQEANPDFKAYRPKKSTGPIMKATKKNGIKG